MCFGALNSIVSGKLPRVRWDAPNRDTVASKYVVYCDVHRPYGEHWSFRFHCLIMANSVLVLWVKIMLIFYKGWRPYRKLAGPGHSWQPRWFPLQSRDSDDLGSYLADDGRRRRGFDAGKGPSNMPRLSGTCRFRNDCSLSWPLLKVRALTEREKPALGDLHAFPVEPTRSDLWAYPQGGKVAFEPPRRHTTCFIGPWWYLPDHFDGFFRKNFDPQMAEIDFFSHRVDPIYRFYVEGMPRFHASMKYLENIGLRTFCKASGLQFLGASSWWKLTATCFPGAHNMAIWCAACFFFQVFATFVWIGTHRIHETKR